MKIRIISGAVLVFAALTLSVVFINSSPTQAPPVYVTYEDYSIPVVVGQPINYPIHFMVSTFPGATAGDQLQSCISALPPAGGTCDATGVTTPLTINSGTNIFANSKSPGNLILGPGTFTIYTQQSIPSNWDISGSGPTTILKNAPNNPFPAPTRGMLINSAAATYSVNSGHNTGISIHDLTIDGNCNWANGGCTSQSNPSEEGITFHGADNSTIYNVYLQNISWSGVDLRDGSNNVVHDCTANDVAMNPTGQHAFGGGAISGLFQNNKFYNNQATGGNPDSGDHYDINGNVSSIAANCTGNQIYNNTSTDAPLAAIFVDSCRNGLVQNNIINSPGTSGVSTSGGSQWATGNTITGNTVNNSGQYGIYLIQNSGTDTVSGNYINSPASQGICLQDSGSNTITSNTISNPGQEGIVCNFVTANCSNNIVSYNTITSTSTMLYGIQFLKPNTTGFLWNNTVTNNTTKGGQAGSTGLGVDVPAGTKTTEVNVLSTNSWSK